MRLFILTFLFLLMTTIANSQSKKPHLNHIALSVIDKNKSRVFYQDILGIDTIPEPFRDGRHVWLSIGDNSHLHLIQNPGPLIIPGKKTHICFSIENINNLIAVLVKSKTAYEDWLGKSSAITTRVDGIHQIYFQDPDGYWIEVNDDFK